MFAKLVGRKEEKIGDVSLLSFIGVVLSRLGYYTNINFLNVYLETFGHSKIIPEEILKKYGSMIDQDLDLFSDELLLDEVLTSPQTITFSQKVQEYINNPAHAKDVKHADIVNTSQIQVKYDIYEKKDANDTQKLLYKHIDFYDMAKKINLLNTVATKGKVFEIEESEQKEENGQTPYTPLNQSDVKYYSISNKSYGGNFILADKRIGNAIFVIFRGTYSAKSAGSYTKPESLFPQKARGSESEYLSGISNLNYAVLHSIMISISKLIEFLGKNEKIQVITCGHSLGGGLATTFSNIFNERLEGFIQKLPNLKALKKKIYVISVAAPRVLSSKTSETYCKKISEGQIFYRRIDTRGDPVPNLPPSGSAEKGFRHPCELGKDKKKIFDGITIDNKEKHENIYRQITGALTKDLNINYNENVDAANYNRRARGKIPSVYLPNPLKHTTYLKIKFTNAVDVSAFATSALPAFAKGASSQSEVSNTKGESVTRIIVGEGTSGGNVQYGINVVPSAQIRSEKSENKNKDDAKILNFPPIFDEMKKLPEVAKELHRVEFPDEKILNLKPGVQNPIQNQGGSRKRKRRRTNKKMKRKIKKTKKGKNLKKSRKRKNKRY